MPFLKDNTAQITKNIWAFNCWHFASKHICDDTNVDTILIHSRETKQNICNHSKKFEELGEMLATCWVCL